jgi:Flp pilus assembly protein CpaB
MENLTQLSSQLMESKAWEHDNFEKVVSDSKNLSTNLRKLKNRVSLSSIGPGWPIASDDLCQLAEAELDRSINCLNEELNELKRQVADITNRSCGEEVSDEDSI